MSRHLLLSPAPSSCVKLLPCLLLAPVAAIDVSHHNDGGVLRAGWCCLSRGVCPLLTGHPCSPPDAAFPLPVWVGHIEVCCDDCEYAGVPQLHCG